MRFSTEDVVRVEQSFHPISVAPPHEVDLRLLLDGVIAPAEGVRLDGGVAF